MPRFKVVELYPQATVRRVMIVEAATLAEAQDDPHGQEILAAGLEIDEGGEARTESASLVRLQYYRKLKTEISKLWGRGRT
jgi:hypothetical protein